VHLAACGGTFLTGLTRLTRPPRLSESDGGQARFFYIPSTSSGPEPVEGLNIPSILSKKWDFLYYQVRFYNGAVPNRLKVIKGLKGETRGVKKGTLLVLKQLKM